MKKALLCFFLVTFIHTASAGVLFESSWDYATGYPDEAIFDGGKWYGGHGTLEPLQWPYVSSGGPGGHNFLNMVTVGGSLEGGGNPYYMNWEISGGTDGDVFGAPEDLYIRVYFRVHQDWVDNLHGSNHWFMGTDNTANRDTKHYLRFEGPMSGEFPDLNTDYIIAVGINAVDEVFAANIGMEAERWYRFEINVHKVNEDMERWYVRLDGVDITDKFRCIAGAVHYGEWLQDLYDSGWSWTNEHHGNLWLATYDEKTLNEGWDVAAIEVRDDTWPGPIGLECRVDASACTISLAGGMMSTCTAEQLQYEYDAAEAVQNNVSGLQPNTTYNILIENITAGTTNEITLSSSAEGTLEFSS